MAALPYMQLYVADYLADTQHLTTEEHGAYLLLLFSYWQTGKPLRHERLAPVVRMSNERWIDVKETLREFFFEDGNQWIHFRVEADLESVNSKSLKASGAGKASARARAARKQGLGQDDSTNVERTNERMLNHTDTETDKENPSCDRQAESLKAAPVRIPYDEILDAFRARLPGFPQPRRPLDEDRRKAIRVLWCHSEKYGSVDFFDRYFQYVAKSEFLTKWKGCGFDWLFKYSNFRKVLEGNYDKGE
jgi:uncharacterized protein YdaU (DUF1376 family)